MDKHVRYNKSLMTFRQIEMEIMATFVINYVVTWTRVSADLNANVDAMQFGLVYGIATAVFVLLCYPECRCHFTPILTIADCLWKRLDLKTGLILLFSQFIGCFMSSTFVIVALNDRQKEYLSTRYSLGHSHIEPPFTAWNGFWVELLFSSLLVFVFLELSRPAPTERGKYWVDYYAAARGLVVLLASLAGESISEVSLNPFAVLSGSVLAQKLLANQWVYYVGPLFGIAIGGLLHHREVLGKAYNEFKQPYDSRNSI